MRLNDWLKREDLQLEWKQLWNENSTLKAGLEVLKSVGFPIETRATQGADIIQHNALMNARREGYFDVIRNIEALKEVKPPQEIVPESWENVKKED
jgi:hypothetical protein